MKTKSKTIFAVIAVTLMLGCGLVPLTNTDYSDGAATEANDDFSDCSLPELINALRNIGKGTEKVDLNNGTSLVAVGETSNQEIPIGPTVTGKTPIGAGDKHTLNGDYTFVAKNGTETGRIVVEKGGEIVLFPLDENNTGFNFVNNNGDIINGNVIVELKSGAIVTIFNTSFKVLYNTKTTDPRDSVFLFRLDCNYSSAISSKAELTYSYSSSAKANEDNFSLTLKMGTCSKFWVFNLMTFEGSEDKTTNDVELSGNLTKTSNVLSIKDGTLNVNSRHGGDKYIVKLNNIQFGLTINSTTDEIIDAKETVSVSGTLSLSFDIVRINLERSGFSINIVKGQGEKTSNFSMEKLDFNLGYVIDNSTVTSKTISVSSDNIEMLFSIMSIVCSGFNTRLTDTFTTITGISFNESLTWNNVQKTWDIDKGELKTGEIKIESAKVELFKWINVLNLTVTIPTMTSTISKDKEPVTSTGVITVLFGMEIVPSKNAKFELDVLLTVQGMKITGDKDSITMAADVVDLKVTTPFNGLDRTFVFKANNVSATKDKDGWLITIDQAYAKNNIPLKSILSGIESVLPTGNVFMDEMKIEAKVADVEIDTFTRSIRSEFISISYDDFGTTDEFYTELEGSLIDFNGSVRCDSVKGYIKDFGKEKEEFSIEGLTSTDPVKLKLGKSDFFPMVFKLEILRGNAVFGKGTLPMTLSIGEYAAFHAEGLSAITFDFHDECSVSGFITIDMNDGLYQLKDLEYRYIKGKHAHTTPYSLSMKQYTYDAQAEAYKCAGYTMTLDLTTFKGRIDANDDFSIPDDIKGEISGIKVNTQDQKSVTFDFTENNSTISFGCIGGLFKIYYSDGTSESHRYNETVTLKTLTEQNFVGWKDKVTGQIYSTREVDSADSPIIVMPARDLYLEPAYCTNAEVEQIEETRTTVFDASKSDVSLIDVKLCKGENVIIIAKNAYIETDYSTLRGIIGSSGDNTFYITSNPMTSTGDKKIDESLKGCTSYNISIVLGDGSTPFYSQSTKMSVTVKATAGDGVKNFKAYYIDSNSSKLETGVSGYVKNPDGTYSVTMEVNHFSNYTIEPVYNKGTDLAMMVTIVATISLILSVMVVLECRRF